MLDPPSRVMLDLVEVMPDPGRCLWSRERLRSGQVPQELSFAHHRVLTGVKGIKAFP